MGRLLFLFFVISQFVAYFNYSNIGTVLAVWLADMLKDANLSSVTLLLAFLVIGFLMSIPVPNILPKWAILAPVFVPLFLKLGIAPDVVLAAYRVSDSPPNVINPLLPHFALVVGFAQRWQKDAGVGTVVAMMLPYAVATVHLDDTLLRLVPARNSVWTGVTAAAARGIFSWKPKPNRPTPVPCCNSCCGWGRRISLAASRRRWSNCFFTA